MTPNELSGSGVHLDRVVAVRATLPDGREQIGSGYLTTAESVLTAAHCTFNTETGEAAIRLRVSRANDGLSAEVNVGSVVADPALDVAVLPLANVPWSSGLDMPIFARVDRSKSGVLKDCEGIGFPLFQRDRHGHRDTSEFHGVIYQTDEAQSGRLLMRELVIKPGPFTIADSPVTSIDRGPSPWGGLSGAITFCQGKAVGVVVEHHPRQGDNALRMIGFDRIAEESSKIRQILGLPTTALELPLATAALLVPLAELVEITGADDLLSVADLNPYRLGATPTDYGDSTNYGVHDPYVERISHDVDRRLRDVLEPGRMALLVGPSKAGKTRTAFEGILARWPKARLLAPIVSELATLVRHPRVAITSDALVVWLDDLQRFLNIADGLTPALLDRLLRSAWPDRRRGHPAD